MSKGRFFRVLCHGTARFAMWIVKSEISRTQHTRIQKFCVACKKFLCHQSEFWNEIAVFCLFRVTNWTSFDRMTVETIGSENSKNRWKIDLENELWGHKLLELVQKTLKYGWTASNTLNVLKVARLEKFLSLTRLHRRDEFSKTSGADMCRLLRRTQSDVWPLEALSNVNLLWKLFA